MIQPTGPRVVLVGTMGAGKTTVGRVLAELWGVPFRDTDGLGIDEVVAQVVATVQDGTRA